MRRDADLTETIEVTVSPEGDVTLETRGFRGKACQEASRPLEQALGVKGEERLTAEYYLPPLRTRQKESVSRGGS